jgi:putative transposase
VERPALKREVVNYIVHHYGLKLARTCRLMKQVRSTQYLPSRKDPKRGYRQLHVLLKREGFQVGINQTYRWYRLEEVQLRSWRKKRRKTAVAQLARMQPLRNNDAWSLNFVADQLSDGTKIRLALGGAHALNQRLLDRRIQRQHL